jgi:hypothetical protein
MSNVVYLEIETAIRAVSWATVEVGRKSLQRITIDFAGRKFHNQYLTGTTRLLTIELGSIRDSFLLIRPIFNAAGHAIFSVSGETASAVGVMPNINYEFSFDVSRTSIDFSGAHDGYPSYNISVNGVSVYDRVQGNITQLLGSADVRVSPVTAIFP